MAYSSPKKSEEVAFLSVLFRTIGDRIPTLKRFDIHGVMTPLQTLFHDDLDSNGFSIPYTVLDKY